VQNRLPMTLISEENDPLGQALLAHLGGTGPAVLNIYSDTTDPDQLDAEYFFRPESAMPDLELLALKHCRGKVLDVGAGGGCHSLLLQKKGMDVLAIDTSPGAVKACQLSGVQQAKQVNFFELPATESYDTILLLMNGIGIAQTLDQLPKMLLHARELLQSGGQILLDSSDLIYLFEEADGSFKIPVGGRYYGEVEYRMTYQDAIGMPFSWLFVDSDLLIQQAATVGLDATILAHGENYHYLAQLTAMSK